MKSGRARLTLLGERVKRAQAWPVEGALSDDDFVDYAGEPSPVLVEDLCDE